MHNNWTYIYFAVTIDVQNLSTLHEASRSKLMENETYSQVSNLTAIAELLVTSWRPSILVPRAISAGQPSWLWMSEKYFSPVSVVCLSHDGYCFVVFWFLMEWMKPNNIAIVAIVHFLHGLGVLLHTIVGVWCYATKVMMPRIVLRMFLLMHVLSFSRF